MSRCRNNEERRVQYKTATHQNTLVVVQRLVIADDPNKKLK